MIPCCVIRGYWLVSYSLFYWWAAPFLCRHMETSLIRSQGSGAVVQDS